MNDDMNEGFEIQNTSITSKKNVSSKKAELQNTGVIPFKTNKRKVQITNTDPIKKGKRKANIDKGENFNWNNDGKYEFY